MKSSIIKIVSIFFVISFMSACSGGKSDTQEGGANSIDSVENISIVDCNLSNASSARNDCQGYTCIHPNDTLVSDSDQTLLEIIHTSSDDKKVCVKNASAHIIR